MRGATMIASETQDERVSRIVSELGLAKQATLISRLSSRFESRRHLRGYSDEAILGASLVVAARMEGLCLRFGELPALLEGAERHERHSHDLDGNYKKCQLLRDIWKIYKRMLELSPDSRRIVSLDSCLAGLFGKAETNPAEEMAALEVLEKVRKHRIGLGKRPAALAGAILYAALVKVAESEGRGLRPGELTQRQIAKLAGVTEVTIRNNWKDIDHMLGLDKYGWFRHR